MTVESASFISGLVPAYPPGSDSISEGDDHLRLIKNVLQGTLPNANAAINGIHTKATAPTSTTAGQLWFDTTNNVLKIRNEADSGWVTLNVSPITDFKLLGSNTIGWVLPTADGVSGQYLTTDAAGNLDWTSASGDELPSQTGHSGKFLTTNGSTASWDTVSRTAATTAFRATMSGNQDIANNTTSTITFDTDDTAPTSFDLGTNFDTTTYKYTAPNTGQYYIGAATRWIGPLGVGTHQMDDNMYIYRHPDGGSAGVAVNFGTMMKDQIVGENNYIGAVTVYQMSSILSLTAEDDIYIRVFTESGDAFRITAGHFEGFQIA